MPWLSVFIIQLCERVPACVSACVRPCMLVLEPTRLMAHAGCVKQCVLANHAIPSKTQLALFIITIWNAVKQASLQYATYEQMSAPKKASNINLWMHFIFAR